MNPIDSIEAGDLKQGLPRLQPGDTVRRSRSAPADSDDERLNGAPSPPASRDTRQRALDQRGGYRERLEGLGRSAPSRV